LSLRLTGLREQPALTQAKDQNEYAGADPQIPLQVHGMSPLQYFFVCFG